MKKITTICCLLVSMNIFAECKKEDAKKAVEHACQVISTKDRSAALAELLKYRYCDSNYVWIQDEDVNMVQHPIKRRLRGSLKEKTTKNGKKLFVEFDKMAKSRPEGGWVDYVWPRVGGEVAEAKISFIKNCGKGLIVGSGVWK